MKNRQIVIKGEKLWREGDNCHNIIRIKNKKVLYEW